MNKIIDNLSLLTQVIIYVLNVILKNNDNSFKFIYLNYFEKNNSKFLKNTFEKDILL